MTTNSDGLVRARLGGVLRVADGAARVARAVAYLEGGHVRDVRVERARLEAAARRPQQAQRRQQLGARLLTRLHQQIIIS